MLRIVNYFFFGGCMNSYIEKQASVGSVLKRAVVPGLATVGTGGLAYGSYKIGANNARKRTMAEAGRANIIENRMIANRFRVYDAAKTKSIVNYFKQKMAAGNRGIEKKSALGSIVESAYYDEMDKMAAFGGKAYKATVNYGKRLIGSAKSLKNNYGAIKTTKNTIKNLSGKTSAKAKMALDNAKADLKYFRAYRNEDISKLAPAAVVGTSAIASPFAAKFLGRKK